MADEKFELVSSYQPTGDQPQAIETLVEGVQLAVSIAITNVDGRLN